MPYSINFNVVIPKLHASNRKQALGLIAAQVAKRIHCEPSSLLSELINKELVSSSGIGNGVAIPNIKMDGLDERVVVLATLQQPVDFDAADGENVDIICLLLSPESHGPIHLRGLSRITRMFKNDVLREKLRDTSDPDMIRALLVNPEGWLMAA